MNKNINIASKLITAQVAAILVFAFVSMISISLFIEKRAEVAAVNSAQQMVKQFVLVRKYYTENVISKILENDTGLIPHFNHKSLPNGIPLPASFIHDLSELLKGDNVSLKFYSPLPFPNRKDRSIDTFGKDAWKALNDNPKTPFITYGQDGNPNIIRVAISDTLVNQICVDCHNSHPMSPKTDWKLGDVRGVLEISRDISTEVSEGVFLGRILALALVVVFGTIVLISFRKQRYEYQKDADILSEKNRELDFQKFALDEHAIVSIADVQGRIIYVNDKFSDISGFSREELIGQNHRIVKSDEHPPEFFAELWKKISSGNVWQGEIKNTKKNGEHYWVKTSIVPFLNDSGKPFKYISIRTDVTGHKEAENRAMAAARAKSNLLANMSHELRTPLNAIIGFSDSMKEEIFGSVGSDKNKEYLEDINSSGIHLLELINDILDLSAFEEGALQLSETNVDISKVAEMVVRIIKPRAEHGKVKVVSSILPETPQIYADERRIKQILINLLSNAVKFTQEGGEVVISSWVNDDRSLSIAVIDTGYGMDDEEISVALSKFGQVDSGHDRKYEGAGLGLPLTKGLVELHGGTLEIESMKHYGTRVTVTFPQERIIQNVS